MQPPLRIMVRLWPDHHGDPDLLDRTLALLTRHRAACDQVWLCTPVGFASLDEHRRQAELAAAAAARFRAAGIGVSLQVAATIGHGGALAFDLAGLAWSPFVMDNGGSDPACACPRDPALHAHLDAMLRLHAAWRPDAVWLDDDLRLCWHGPAARGGCFCPRCLAGFAAGDGRAWERESLVTELQRPGGEATRAAWIEWGRAALFQLAATCARAVRAVAPEAGLGYQQIAHENTLDQGGDCDPVYAAFAAEGARALSRTGHGYYRDHAPRDVLVKTLGTARQVARLPALVASACPEIESFPHTALNKSPQAVAVEASLALAVGCDALSLALICADHEDSAVYGRLLERVAAWRPFWERFLAACGDARPWGLDPALGRNHALRRLRDGEAAWAWAACPVHERLAGAWTLGLPLAPDAAGAPSLLLGDAVDGFEDATLRVRLASGVLTDIGGLGRLHARVPKELGGVACASAGPEHAWDVFSTDAANGPYAGHRWRSFGHSSPQRLLLPPGARILSDWRPTDDHRDLGPASALCPLPGGGRLAVLGGNPWDAGPSTARRHQLLEAAAWLLGGLPLRVDPAAPVVVIPRCDRNGRLRAALLMNASVDATPPLRLTTRERFAGLRWATPGADAVDLSAQDGGHVFAAPPLAAWSVACVSPPA